VMGKQMSKEEFCCYNEEVQDEQIFIPSNCVQGSNDINKYIKMSASNELR
jgi:hypothetical protein